MAACASLACYALVPYHVLYYLNTVSLKYKYILRDEQKRCAHAGESHHEVVDLSGDYGEYAALLLVYT